jgi:DNA-binding MarR family transcriptional regulator
VRVQQRPRQEPAEQVIDLVGQVQEVAAQGGVEVIADPDDRRARIVRLSDRGREVIAALLDMQAGYERAWAQQVGAARWAGAREVLTELFWS